MSSSRAKKKQRRGGSSSNAAAAPPSPPTSAPRRIRGAGASRLEVRDGVARPRPIWAPFPLTEIGIAVGIAILVAGMLGGALAWLLIRRFRVARERARIPQT